MTRHARTVAALLLAALGVWLLSGVETPGPAEVIYQPGTVIHGTPAPSSPAPAPTPTEGAYSHAV